MAIVKLGKGAPQRVRLANGLRSCSDGRSRVHIRIPRMVHLAAVS